MPIRTTLSQRNKSKGVLTWYARVFDTETKEIRYVSLHTTKKTAAKDLMDAMKARGEFERKERTITLSEAFDLLEKDNSRRNFKDSTVYIYKALRKAFTPLKDKDMDNIRPTDISDCLASFLPCNPSTYNQYLTKTRRLFSFIGAILEKPSIPYRAKQVERMKVPRSQKVQFWTMEQVEQLLDKAPSARLRLAWSFMAFAGLRRSEVINLKPGNIKDGWIELVGKGDKFARVPIGSRLRQELERYGHPFDFHDMKSTVYYYLKKTAEEIFGDCPAHPHMFRHSFASNLIRGKAGIKETSLLLRHSSIGITMNTYTHLLDGDLEKSIEMLENS